MYIPDSSNDDISLTEISREMVRIGIDKEFIRSVSHYASKDRNIFDLMVIWYINAGNEGQRQNCIKDMAFAMMESSFSGRYIKLNRDEK